MPSLLTNQFNNGLSGNALIMAQLETRQIGSTGLEVTTMGIGGAALGGIFSEVTRDEAVATVRAGLEAGLRYADTAPFYGYGHSERRMGDALQEEAPGSYVLSTKAGRLLVPDTDTSKQRPDWVKPLPFRADFDYSYDGIMRSVEDSYQRLGLATIDILYMHDIAVDTHGEADLAHHWPIAMDGGVRAMNKLRDQGVVKAIGLGVNGHEACMEAMKYGDWDVFLLAGRYTLLEQAVLDDFLPTCVARGCSIVIGGPYNSGILAGGDTWNYERAPQDVFDKVAKIKAVCDSHGVALPQAALQFPLNHPAVASVIPGARSVEEMRMNFELMTRPIPSSLWSDLKGQGLMHPDAPVPA